MGVFVFSFTKISDEVIRPLVPIRVINPFTNQRIDVIGLLDTGADDNLFPEFIASNTGHNLKASGVISNINQGVGQSQVPTWKHTFIIELLSPDRTKIIWKSKQSLISCVDHNNAPPLLGCSGFLINMKITFNYTTKKIIIEIP